MIKKNFIKNEPLIFKILYWIGIICLIIHLLDLSILNNSLNKLFSIIGYGGMSFFWIRIFIYNKKNGIN
jgi:hypothetical protein